MNDRLKKIILIIIFIVVVLLIGGLIYYLFFRPFIAPPTPTPTPPPANVNVLPPVPPTNVPVVPNINALPNINLPEGIPETPPTVPGPEISPIAEGGITSFTTLEDAAINSPSLSNNGTDLIYYNNETGFFYRTTPDGQKQLFSDIPFKNVENATWSPNNQQVVLEYPDGSNVIYDFKNKRSTTLPAHWEDFVFSPQGNQLAFKDLRVDPNNRYIAVVNADGTGYRRIEALGENEDYVYMTWSPNDEYVALYREPFDGYRNTIYPIGFNNENFRSFTVEGSDLRFTWKPNGDKLLYSVYSAQSDYKPTLWLVNTTPDLLATGRKNLGIKTWADKCTFASETTAYCAVPRSLETGIGFRPELANGVPDDIYKIDITTGSQELVAEPLFSTSIKELIISQDGKYLYWVDNNTGKLRKINL